MRGRDARRRERQSHECEQKGEWPCVSFLSRRVFFSRVPRHGSSSRCAARAPAPWRVAAACSTRALARRCLEYQRARVETNKDSRTGLCACHSCLSQKEENEHAGQSSPACFSSAAATCAPKFCRSRLVSQFEFTQSLLFGRRRRPTSSTPPRWAMATRSDLAMAAL